MSARIAIIAATACVACGGDGGAPVLTVLAWGGNIAQLSWTHPTDQSEGGYSVEARIEPAPFARIALISPGDLGDMVDYGAFAPELANVDFRVRALPDPDGGRASNLVTLHRALQPGVLSCNGSFTCYASADGFELSWTIASAVADALLLERSSDFQTWTTLPVSYPATSYADAEGAQQWYAGKHFTYRLSFSKGNEVSPYSFIDTN
jgi:hypothetical protein